MLKAGVKSISNNKEKICVGHILLVEDDLSTVKMIELALTRANFKVTIRSYGEDALEEIENNDYDLVLLDLLLPDIDGMLVLEKIRDSKLELPVMILTGVTTMDNKIDGLSSGADDYLTKPFDRRELIARVNVLIKRKHSYEDSKLGRHINFHGLRFSDAEHCVFFDGKRIFFTHKEFQILHLLASASGKPVSKEKIMEAVYSRKNIEFSEEPTKIHRLPDPKILDVFLYKIRKKLTSKTNGRIIIKTEWRRGLKLHFTNDSQPK